jgi:hypothetical protein
MILRILILSLLVATVGCQNTDELNNKLEQLSAKVTELEEAQNISYKPGLGVLMNAIQAHHLKLWKAGDNANWDLAGFELHELEERFEDIETYHPNHEETKQLSMIYPQIEAVEGAVESNDRQAFDSSYEVLTATCNSCHELNDHPFVKIKVPNDGGGNQEFGG